MKEKIVDARGLACPQPVIETRSALADPTVRRVKVLVDDEASAENVARMARSLGCSVAFESSAKNEFSIQLERAPGVPMAMTQAEPLQSEATGEKPLNVAVLITAKTIGRGDDELGRILMVAFIKTLKEIVPRPKTLIFMNGGVTLATTGSELIEAISELASQGTNVLVCGTCLDFFHLKNDVQVGVISNTFEIASVLVAADRVMYP